MLSERSSSSTTARARVAAAAGTRRAKNGRAKAMASSVTAPARIRRRTQWVIRRRAGPDQEEAPIGDPAPLRLADRNAPDAHERGEAEGPLALAVPQVEVERHHQRGEPREQRRNEESEAHQRVRL